MTKAILTFPYKVYIFFLKNEEKRRIQWVYLREYCICKLKTHMFFKDIEIKYNDNDEIIIILRRI